MVSFLVISKRRSNMPFSYIWKAGKLLFFSFDHLTLWSFQLDVKLVLAQTNLHPAKFWTNVLMCASQTLKELSKIHMVPNTNGILGSWCITILNGPKGSEMEAPKPLSTSISTPNAWPKLLSHRSFFNCYRMFATSNRHPMCACNRSYANLPPHLKQRQKYKH